MKKISLFVAMAMTVLSLNAQNAYLLLESSVSNLPTEYSEGEVAENPEQNAANWFQTQYVKKGIGSFISASEIAGAAAKGVKTIWVNVEREGLADIKDAKVSDGVVADLKAFVEAGGNLLLTKQAVMVAHRMGRMYEPTWGATGYNVGGDVWSINPHVGLWWTLADTRRDNWDHPIFEGLDEEAITDYSATMEEDGEAVPYPTLPLIGMVARTDDNISWIDYFRKDLSAADMKMVDTEGVTHYSNDNVLRLPDFEEDWNVKVLACWGHVQDYCGGVVVELNPDGNFKGRIMTIGASAYQWGSSNDYISNVKKLTKNALNYLTGEIESGVEKVAADKEVKGIYNVMGMKVETMQKGQLYIVDGKKVIY